MQTEIQKNSKDDTTCLKRSEKSKLINPYPSSSTNIQLFSFLIYLNINMQFFNPILSMSMPPNQSDLVVLCTIYHHKHLLSGNIRGLDAKMNINAISCCTIDHEVVFLLLFLCTEGVSCMFIALAKVLITFEEITEFKTMLFLTLSLAHLT